MDYATLSAAALALVVVLAVFVTFAAVAPLAGEGPRGGGRTTDNGGRTTQRDNGRGTTGT